MKVKEASIVYDVLKRQPREAFDGHTEFNKMTPDQRLIWLGQAAYFVYMNKGKATASHKK